MNWYDYDEIKQACDCRDIARELGLTLKGDRCAATWRGGDNPDTVAFTERGWFDHKTQEKGSAIDLVAAVLFGGNIIAAQDWLGEWLKLKPTASIDAPKSSRLQDLVADGYIETRRYDYVDLDGALLYQVVRFEHPDKPKQFMQCDAEGRWTIKGVKRVLYNWPAIAHKESVAIVEGEKDAETLKAWGLPVTTNAGGSKNWEESFSRALAGKRVLLLPDNDDAGRAHLDVVGKSLAPHAAEIRVLTISKLPKGDVTDWVEQEGGSKGAFIAASKAAPLWIPPSDDDMALAAAKEANKKPLLNYWLEKQTDPAGNAKFVKKPRLPKDLVEDVHSRFLGFPRKVGETLFDHDRDTGRIETITTPNELFAWMAMKGKYTPGWFNGTEYLTKAEFFSLLQASATRYEGTSNVPDYPPREDIFYTHGPLPQPSRNHEIFEGLIDFFEPAAPEYRTLLKALFAAPIFYQKGIARPMWIIDSEDGAGTGKTTLAEMVAKLYGAPVATASKSDFRQNEELIKRLVSSTGREKRVLLLDNLTGNFRSDELCQMVTSEELSGRPPYGKGEESRPNNLTYILTANSAAIDSDIASRAFFIFLRRPKQSADWKGRLLRHIDANRLAIFADIIDILASAETENMEAETRFPQFERHVLRPLCPGLEEFGRVLDVLAKAREAADTDEELAGAIADCLREHLRLAQLPNPDAATVFIYGDIAKEWLEPVLGKRPVVQTVKHLANMGYLKEIDPKRPIYPSHAIPGLNKRRGIFWRPPDQPNEVQWLCTGTAKQPQISVAPTVSPEALQDN